MLNSGWSFYYSSKVADSRVQGLVGANNSGTPNTQYDFKADLVQLRDRTTGHGVAVENTGTITCNVLTAGPAANGRDQAGAFSASSWIHFYFIWNPATSTLATLASAVAPPTGPTLPSGYTHWAYATAIRYNATPLLVDTRVRGCVAHYTASTSLLSGGSSTTEAAVDASAVVPPNALSFGLFANINAGHSGVLLAYVRIRVLTTVNYLYFGMGLPVADVTMDQVGYAHVPNVAQNLYYLWVLGYVTRSLDLSVHYFCVPNGDA